MKLHPVEAKLRDAMRGGRALTRREARQMFGVLGVVYFDRWLDRGVSMKVQVPGGTYGATLREFAPARPAPAEDPREALRRRTEEEQRAAAARVAEQEALVARLAALPPAERAAAIAEERALALASQALASDAAGDVPLDVFNLDTE